MYLRTPKRYRPGRRRQLRLFSKRTLFLLILIPALGYGGWMIWQHQQQVRDAVLPEIEHMAEAVQTQVAARPTPTPTPNLAEAQAGCINARQMGDYEEAIEQCAVLAESRPNDVNLHYEIAHMMVITSGLGSDTQRLQDALQFAEKTVNANPEVPHGWAVRAMVLDWLGEYQRALASALHARAIDPDFAPTYVFLGSIYIELGQPETAVANLDQALELDTSGDHIPDIFRTRGWLYANQANYDDAIRAYQTAIDYAPNQTYLRIELALNYLAMRDTNAALQVLSEALEIDPTDPAVLFYMGNAQVNSGNRERGYEYYRRCLDADPDNVPCLSFLGGLQYSDDDWASAAVNLTRAIELGSDDPIDYFQLGRSHSAAGRCDLALPYLREGYQMLLAEDNYNPQTAESFVNALNSCGDVTTTQPVQTVTPAN